MLANLNDRWSLIKVSGNDRVSFLHAQLTNSIDTLANGEAAFAGYCDPKGRLLASLYICVQSEHLLILIPKSISNNTINRLRMFVLRSDVQLSDVSETASFAGFIGSHDDAVSTCGGQVDAQFFTLHPNIHLAVGIEETNSQHLGGGEFESALVNSGIPSITDATAGQFVPQWVNLDLVNGLNFKKGCYPGQEIVARTHYLGRLKKRMYLLKGDASIEIDLNSSLYGTQSEQTIGNIVNVIHDEQHTFALAVCRIENATETSQFNSASDQSGVRFELAELPYPVTGK